MCGRSIRNRQSNTPPAVIPKRTNPLSEALIQGTISTRPAFIEVFLEDNKLFYRPVDAEKAEGVLLYEN